MTRHFLFLISLICFSGLACAQILGMQKKTGVSGTSYTFFLKNTCQLAFTDQRPSTKDPAVLLCIPAAFTNTGNDQVDGIYAVNGLVKQANAINTSLGGVCYLENGACRMFQSGKGRLFGDSLLAIVKTNRASFFQQIQCIQKGKPAGFIDQKLFQRRGIAILKNGTVAVIESREAITLKVFAADLAALGVRDLIYTDMGAWDEGWYRDPATGLVKTIGLDRSQTARQSNWIVFRK